MSIAVFGGTFDPIHMGHLIIAEQAYNSFGVDDIIFMPAGNPPHKLDKKITRDKHRLNMINLVVRDNSHFSVSTLEMELDKKSYTYETLIYMKEKYPDEDIYFIIGSDSLQDIYDWKKTDYLLKNANFIVASRPGFSLENILSNEKFKPYRKYINLLDNSMIDISSTQIRKLLAENKSIRYLTIPEVIEYIKIHSLYQNRSE
ncbi:MAG: nicotinate-nucleotide adenylyltransferase [Halanaerobiaceae bacterium]